MARNFLYGIVENTTIISCLSLVTLWPAINQYAIVGWMMVLLRIVFDSRATVRWNRGRRLHFHGRSLKFTDLTYDVELAMHRMLFWVLFIQFYIIVFLIG